LNERELVGAAERAVQSAVESENRVGERRLLIEHVADARLEAEIFAVTADDPFPEGVTGLDVEALLRRNHEG